MSKKRTKNMARIMGLLMAVAFVLASVIEPMPVSAHANTSRGGAPKAQKGQIIIDYVDADVLGAQVEGVFGSSVTDHSDRHADADGNTIGGIDDSIPMLAQMVKSMSGIPYWGAKGSNVMYRDFAYTPQGLGTFAERKFDVYVFPLGDGSEIFRAALEKKDDSNTNGYVCIDDIISWNTKEDMKKYRVAKEISGSGGRLVLDASDLSRPGSDGEIQKGDYIFIVESRGGQSGAYYSLTGDTFYYVNAEGDHKRHMWEMYIQYDPDAGVYVQWDADMSSKPWITAKDSNNLINTYNDIVAEDGTENAKHYKKVTEYKQDESPMMIGAYPLANVIERGGFQFRMEDNELDRAMSQGDAQLFEGAKFAIYNINWTAEGWSSSSITTAGYVLADRNYDGNLSDEEMMKPIPAYKPDEIISAWQTYLKNGSDFEKALQNVGAPYGMARFNANGREFVIGNVTRSGSSVPILPVMVVTPDSNGVVKISETALPAGNYLVLQIDAGEGYYIDENFRPIVSIGRVNAKIDLKGTLGDGTPFNGNAVKSILGETQGPVVLDKYPGTGIVDIVYTYTISNGTVMNKENPGITVNMTNGTNPGTCNVIAVPTGTCLDISNAKIAISNGKVYGMNVSEIELNGREVRYGFDMEYPAEDPTFLRAINYANGSSVSSYVQVKTDKTTNVKFAADTARMKPDAYDSRFMVHDTVIRSGGDILLADRDDVGSLALYGVKYVSGKNLQGQAYVAEPQGDGRFDGVKFTIDVSGKVIYDIRTGTELTDSVLEFTLSESKADIPVNMLPYGTYLFSQTTTGEGYMIADDVQASTIVVRIEDQMDFDVHASVPDSLQYRKSTGQMDYEDPAYPSAGATNGRSYVTNTLTTGGELYTISCDQKLLDPNDTVTISVYNISDHYIWTDAKAGNKYYDTLKDFELDGNKERYETMQSVYERSIKGHEDMSLEQLMNLLKSSNNAKCREIKIPIGSVSIGITDDLPYGRYLIVMTDVPDGYELEGPFFTVDDIESEGDEIEFEAVLSLMPPALDTTAIDASNGTHTVSASNDAVILDTVTYVGLEAKTEYLLVTRVADARTGLAIEQIPAVETKLVTSEMGSGRTTVRIPVNTSNYKGRSLVVFEELYDAAGATLIYSHCEPGDIAQTVTVPSLKTVLTGSDGSLKSVTANIETTLVDVLNYTGLTPGVTYQIETSVANKVTGNTIGSPVITEFTPEEADGVVAVTFTVNTLDLNGQKIVAYEIIKDSYTGEAIIAHKDINDSDQTVTVAGFGPGDGEDPANEEPDIGKPVPQTGVDDNTVGVILMITLLGLTVLAAAVGPAIRSRWNKK